MLHRNMHRQESSIHFDLGACKTFLPLPPPLLIHLHKTYIHYAKDTYFFNYCRDFLTNFSSSQKL